MDIIQALFYEEIMFFPVVKKSDTVDAHSREMALLFIGSVYLPTANVDH